MVISVSDPFSVKFDKLLGIVSAGSPTLATRSSSGPPLPHDQRPPPCPTSTRDIFGAVAAVPLQPRPMGEPLSARSAAIAIPTSGRIASCSLRQGQAACGGGPAGLAFHGARCSTRGQVRTKRQN